MNRSSSLIALACCVFFVASSLSAQWLQTPGFSNQQLLSIAIKDTCLFIGTDFEGIFRSTDLGNSWSPVNNGLTQQQINALCVRGGDIFAGTFSGLFKSSDNGTTWSYAGLNGVIVDDIVADNQYLFAGTDNGVYRSDDNGRTWILKNAGLTGTFVYTLHFHGTRLYAGTWSDTDGIFASSDNGETWETSGAGLSFYDISTFVSIGSDIFAGTNGGGVYRSLDEGAHWASASSLLTNGIIGKLYASGENLFAGTYGGGVFLSTNRGVSWMQVNTGLQFLYVGPLARIGSYLFAGTFGSGLYKTQLGSMPIVYSDTAVVSTAAGWNLISIPIVPYLTSPQTLMRGTISTFGYSSGTSSYIKTLDMAYGNGYWTFTPEPTSTSVYGMIEDTTAVDVPRGGWVMFGSRSTTVPASNLMSIPAGSMLGTIYRYATEPGIYQSAAEIVPGRGYWVYVSQPCRLILR